MAKYETTFPSLDWFRPLSEGKLLSTLFFSVSVMCLWYLNPATVLAAEDVQIVPAKVATESARTAPATSSATQFSQTQTDSITLQPSFQEVILNESDQLKKSSIQLSNGGDEAVHVRLEAAEIQQVDIQGNVILSDKPMSPATALATYISFEQPSFILESHQVISVPFTIHNSVDLSPGGHYSAVIARFEAEEQGEPLIVPAISSFVIVRKTGGEQYHLSMSDVKIHRSWWSMPKQLTLRFNNQGNAHLTPHGLIEVLDWNDHRVALGIINVDSMIVLPQSEREMSVPLREQGWVWPVWLYTVKISGHAPPSEITFQQQIPLVIIHWPSLAVVIIVLIILTFVGRFITRKIRSKWPLQLKKVS